MNIRVIRASCLVLALACLSAPALGQSDDGEDNTPLPFKPSAERGLAMSTKLCASCHVVSSDQTGTTQPDIPSFMYIANKPGQTEVDLARNMIHPFPPMVDLHLTMHEIEDITAYIMSLKKPAATP